MNWKNLLSLAIIVPFADALLRFPCSQLVTERFDPLITPGEVSPHLHQIVGGNAFNLSMHQDLDLPRLSTCTTCRFKEDFSNYWTAVLFFKHTNGSFTRVPQVANQAVGSPNGGMTVYYIQPPNNGKVTAFKKGFRMIVGNPMLRAANPASANIAAARSLTFRCFTANQANNVDQPGGPQDTVNLPTKKCDGGIRTNIYFPSCWDGKNLDTADHVSHVTWPSGNPGTQGLFFFGGSCPSTHPVRLPLILLETVWDTARFNSLWPTDGTQPFVYSMGDPTGYGQHGDYLFGWDGDSLQRAMDTCTDTAGVPTGCRALTTLSDAEINKCTKAEQVPENNSGYLRQLPGCNPIQNGPGAATMPASCTAVSTLSGQPAATNTQAGTTVISPTPTPPPAGGPTVPLYGQCGGSGYTGNKVCATGSTCTRVNDWYSQCL